MIREGLVWIIFYVSLVHAQQCAPGQAIEGFTCGGRGGITCPSGSTCQRDPMTGTGTCCWDSQPSPAAAPCDYPLLQPNGEFATCSTRDQNSCNNRCHTCERLTAEFDMGLCCPQLTMRGCENASQTLNEFNRARQQIMGSSDSFPGSGTGIGFSGTGSGSFDIGGGTVSGAPGDGFNTAIDFGLSSTDAGQGFSGRSSSGDFRSPPTSGGGRTGRIEDQMFPGGLSMTSSSMGGGSTSWNLPSPGAVSRTSGSRSQTSPVGSVGRTIGQAAFRGPSSGGIVSFPSNDDIAAARAFGSGQALLPSRDVRRMTSPQVGGGATRRGVGGSGVVGGRRGVMGPCGGMPPAGPCTMTPFPRCAPGYTCVPDFMGRGVCCPATAPRARMPTRPGMGGMPPFGFMPRRPFSIRRRFS